MEEEFPHKSIEYRLGYAESGVRAASETTSVDLWKPLAEALYEFLVIEQENTHDIGECPTCRGPTTAITWLTRNKLDINNFKRDEDLWILLREKI